MPYCLFPDGIQGEAYEVANIMLTTHFGCHTQSQLSADRVFGEPEGNFWSRVPTSRQDAEGWVRGARSGLIVPGSDAVPGYYGYDAPEFNGQWMGDWEFEEYLDKP